jgi:hypothetical protein
MRNRWWHCPIQPDYVSKQGDRFPWNDGKHLHEVIRGYCGGEDRKSARVPKRRAMPLLANPIASWLIYTTPRRQMQKD